MQIDFTTLNNEYAAYWATRNLSGAIANLQNIDNYISQGNGFTFGIPDNLLLQPNQLGSLYALNNGTDIATTVSQVNYSDMLGWFRNYLQSEVTSIADMVAEAEAQSQLSEFDKILDTISTGISSGLMYGIIILVFFFAIYLYKAFK